MTKILLLKIIVGIYSIALVVYFIFLPEKVIKTNLENEINQFKQFQSIASYNKDSVGVTKLEFYATDNALETKKLYVTQLSKKKNDDSISKIATIGLKFFKENVSAPTVTAAGAKSYWSSISTRETSIATTLENKGIQKPFAKKYALKITRYITSKLFRRVAVFTTATGAVYTVEQVIMPKLSFMEKLAVAILIGLIILLLYITANKKGILK